MARNRKHQSAAIRFGPAMKAVFLCALIGGSGVGFVWQKSQIDDLGRQIGKREARLRELNEQNKKLRDQLATMRSPQFLENRIRELNLGLARPEPSQVWRLTEPEPASDRKDAPRQYAAQTRPGAVPE
jgi:cell division protein FtsL